MKKKSFFLLLFCIIYSLTNYFIITHTLNDFLSFEDKNRSNLLLEQLKNEISRHVVSEDDITLNNSLESFLKQPEVLKITIIRNGRVIADSNPADINLKTASLQELLKVEASKNVRNLENIYTFEKQTYQLRLKIDNNFTQPLKISLFLSLSLSAFIFFLVLISIFSFSGRKHGVLPPPANNNTLSLADFILDSDSAVVLVLAGDNKIIKASKKALEIFTTKIEGTYIMRPDDFEPLQKYFSSGKKPFIIDGNKYFIF